MATKTAALNPNLNLFTIPPTDLTTASYRYIKVPPQTSSITPIHVNIERQSDYIDLERSFVELDLGFKTTANSNPTSLVDDVNRMTAPANNLAHTLFKQVNFRANGTLLTEQVDMYYLKAFIQTVINYDGDDGETTLQPTGWRNEIDSPVTYTINIVKPSHTDFTGLSANQQSSIKAQIADARDFYVGGKRTLRMKPFVDAFHQGKRIVPRTLSELEFYLNGAALIFNVEAATGTIDEEVRINTDDIKLTFYHCLVKLNPSVYMELASTMSKTPAKYPMIRKEMRQFPLDNGATSKEINNPVNGKALQRVIPGILETTAFNGQYNKDPFAF